MTAGGDTDVVLSADGLRRIDELLATTPVAGTRYPVAAMAALNG